MTTQTKAKPKAAVFNLTAPVLAQGRYDSVMNKTEHLNLRIKVYAEGGENAMHFHNNEDHAFVVLQGQATFHTETDDNISVVNQWEGIMIPKGAPYYFQSSGDVNLVLLRAGTPGDRGAGGRMNPRGDSELTGHSAENKHIDGVPVPGKFFGFQ